MAKKEPDHIGGRLAANFRRANIAEGFAIQMFRPFCALAEVEREEDHGIDLVATLLRRDGLSLIAEDSFLAQVKTHTAASFMFKGDGIDWLRNLRLPYFPVIANLNDATVELYTLNHWHWVIHTSRVNRYIFRPTEEIDHPDDFPLRDPLMKWSMAECVHADFPQWAYSILKPAVRIETMNQQYGPMWRFVKLVGGPYYFKDRNADGTAIDPPNPGSATEIAPGNGKLVREMLLNVLGQFANWVSNSIALEDRGGDLLNLRESFRRLGLDPDPTNRWDDIAKEMADWLEQSKAKAEDKQAQEPPS